MPSQRRQIDPSTEGPPDTSVATLTEMSEAALKAGIIHTHVSRWLAWLLTAAFVMFIAAVPITQAIGELRHRQRIGALDLFKRTPSRENLQEFEHTLEVDSAPRNRIRPRLQSALSSWLGFGNVRVALGADGLRANGWLFYEPTIAYVGGRGFLEEESFRQRRAAAADERLGEIYPDPRPAILQFHRSLASRGVRLIVMPLPTKPMLQPHQLSASRFPLTTPTGVPNNPDFPRFISDLRAAGIEVFDPTPQVLLPGEPARFLQQDTHWTPQWMEQVANDLASHLGASAAISKSDRPSAFAVDPMQVSRVGDLVDLLQLSPGQKQYAPQTVTVRRVRDPAGSLWNSNSASDVLVLGDSFCNIYSDATMGWGESAGFAEHLSVALGRDVDLIAINDRGAHVTREALAGDLARGRDRLAGKRVVVWEFTVRVLANGDWKPIDLPFAVAAPAGRFIVPKPGEPITVTGVVARRSAVADPSAVPYADQIIAVHLVDLKTAAGPITGGEALVYLMAMHSKSLTAAAHCREGQTLHLTLRNWNDVALRYGRISRSELNSESILTEPPCWGELIVGN